VPLRWDQDACPSCGAEFEPLRPRTRKGEAVPTEPATRGQAPGEDASPFEGDEKAERAPGEREDVTSHSGSGLIDQPWPQIQPPVNSRFALGSYGRIGIAVESDLNGAETRNVVDFGPRLTKFSYQELHFYYRDRLAEMPVLVKSTVAFEEDLFHENGDFDAQFALREAYAELEPSPSLAVWMGARMYRGDDIYLFDFWPLDDQNTVGGGAAIKLGESQRLQVHAGFNRIVDDSAFQFQTIELPREDAVGTREAAFLDRYRGTMSATYRIELGDVLLKAHGELSYLPSGKRQIAGGAEQRLPADHGFLLGGQAAYNFGPQSFARLFVTYARGLSAFDELAVPFGFDQDFSVTDASYWRVAIGGAFDSDFFGLHWGAYWQMFEDSDDVDDRDDNEQIAVAIRPMVYLGEYFRVGAEASIQARNSEGIFQETGQKEDALVTEFALLAGVAAGKGPFARPALYVYWNVNSLNRGAELELSRRLADRPEGTEHRFGFIAEWWF
jgi:maltoporin